ncbi:short-chain dehydrogenase/reductase SDR [Tolypothrix tenuis PCC 7101]|uniref:Short-chain dehydrogenase/reductase SDR n=1 Tax=Tolypothrix tenuis PCC 7101 TaxID=231146 RepID=A0A1Z4MYJ5_9CYAN|nr:SDR family oxidoreductase [Aulosira sp. FACHB-113]BAY98556.1 short-chain dehydrogenase/reductase SDR [Tolypothrix tenuis PCC 7101]BAZ77525.1 short-chain dehydrogenase/reductase SDR [Aulosira laxa NIES-50]
MDIKNSVVLVTGANRGIGEAFVKALSDAGASRIYATARNIDSLKEIVAISSTSIIPLELDITNLEQIAQVAELAQDVNLLINNAGVGSGGGFFKSNSVEMARWEMETNYFGSLYMIRAFAPILKQNGGGAIANILSIASVINMPMFGSYSASKAALHSLTQGVRAELAAQGTLVVGVFPGPVDTDMGKQVPLDKVPPSQIALSTLQAIEQGIEDVSPDATSQQVFASIQQDAKALEKQFATLLPQ